MQHECLVRAEQGLEATVNWALRRHETEDTTKHSRIGGYADDTNDRFRRVLSLGVWAS